MITPLRRILLEASPLYYPFGNTPSRNVLKDLNFQSGAHDVTKVQVRYFFVPLVSVLNKISRSFYWVVVISGIPYTQQALKMSKVYTFI